jgi:DNA-binding transcriptional LysR family regulator
MVELSHLRYFIALAEELHFARAAERLQMAQPPLTRQIKQLEANLHCRLFERTSRSTRLTTAGSQFLIKARSIVEQADLAIETIQRLGQGDEGQLTVATAPSLMLGFLPQVIRIFRRRYPRVLFRLTETASSEIVKALRAGSADLGLIRGEDRDPDVRTLLQWKEPMVAILPPDHAFRSVSRVALGALRDEPFVLFPREVGPSFHEEVLRQCKKSGFKPVIAQEARQWSSIISLVSAGMGVSVGPASVAALLPKAARYPWIQNFDTTVQLAASVAAANDPVLTNFMQLVRQYGRVA